MFDWLTSYPSNIVLSVVVLVGWCVLSAWIGSRLERRAQQQHAEWEAQREAYLAQVRPHTRRQVRETFEAQTGRRRQPKDAA